MKNRKTLFTAMAGVVAAFAVYKVIAVLTGNLGLNYFVLLFLRETVFAAAALFLAFRLHKTGVFEQKTKGWGAGLLTGMYFLVMTVLATADGITRTAAQGGPTIHVWEFLLLLAAVAMVGLNEELLFRGILQNAFLDFFGEASVGSVRKSLACGGLFFGFLHIFNIFTGAPVSNTILQVIQVSLLGMLFGAVYFRSRRNLWVCMVIHAVYDLSSFLLGGVLLGITSDPEARAAAALIAAVPDLIILACFLFVTRKKKIEPLLRAE